MTPANLPAFSDASACREVAFPQSAHTGRFGPIDLPESTGGPMKTTIVQGRTPLEIEYLAQMRMEGLSEETIRQRTYVLRSLPVPPAEATVEHLREALSPDLSASTRATYLRIFRTIFADLNRLELMDNDPARLVRVPKQPRRQPRPMPRADIDKCLAMPDADGRAFTILGAFAGLRAGEVTRVCGADLIDTDDGPGLHVIGKGGVEAVIPAHPLVVELLEPFAGDREPIWPWWAKSVNRRWQRGAAEVGVRGFTFHQLRHGYATQLYKLTAGDLLTVAALCRHASVATTQGYAKVAQSAPFRAVVGL